MQIAPTFSLTLALAAAFALSGCNEELPEIVPQVRAIKTYTVSEVASGQTRKFAGQVHATDSSKLSFHVSGTVIEMLVKEGNRVEKGQILAVVDKQPYKLDVESAEADFQKARAELTRARQEFERQEELFKKDWVAKKRLERVQTDLDTAESQLDFAMSKLNLANRDLQLTDLRAPYDGTISRKHIDAFVEVRTGQPVYDIEAIGTLEVRFDVPETVISRVSVGMPVTVKLPTSEGGILQARITEVSSTAGTANAFPVKASLDDPPAEIRSGMTTETTILLKQEGAGSGFLVPLSAIAPGDAVGQGYAFIYDAKTQTVKKTLVKGKGAADNFVNVVEGIEVGDIVASAGVTFLRDGQRVKLMQQQTSSAVDARTGTK
ncbi:MAG: efflux RND transporter periplasmic adaptor subunit [Burkholderiales bacterium]|nr:efflux RND transporter periplasmic adaptor subunit [Burkholderiales bacterium]